MEHQISEQYVDIARKGTIVNVVVFPALATKIITNLGFN